MKKKGFLRLIILIFTVFFDKEFKEKKYINIKYWKKMLYRCEICGFESPLKGNLSKHLKTRKHAFNLKEKNGMNQNEPKLAHLVHGQKSKKNEMNQNEPKLALLVHEPNEPKTAHSREKKE